MGPERSATEQTSCQHHWVIETSVGPTSNGVCRRCGEERKFENTIEANTWGRGIKLGRPAKDIEG